MKLFRGHLALAFLFLSSTSLGSTYCSDLLAHIAHAQFEIAPFAETPRTIMHPLNEADIDRVTEIVADGRVAASAGKRLSRFEVETRVLESRLLPGEKDWNYTFVGIYSRADGSLTGVISIKKASPEFLTRLPRSVQPTEGRCAAVFGYALAPSAWGKGITTEAAKEFVARSFSRGGITAIYADVASDNVASIRVLEKIGFKKLDTGPRAVENIFELKAPTLH